MRGTEDLGSFDLIHFNLGQEDSLESKHSDLDSSSIMIWDYR